ncbi:hypothetical protein RIU81_24320 [Salmonella enterica subsp. enterica serovar Gatineau]|uniref:hypothetical protein n=1 Tax=Salmonella enterica TaxID=28901 RepID=UPI001078CCAE|nr:hypothetical protein [Salmonella enterica]ECG1483911.1 hypothetical protein [Salmonella enterica subsp. enterica]EAA9322491.1 hypothetical protein [Salmonella enterica]EGG4121088.1 hypothetical protein [Salmonella enterica]EGG4135168.1 hypothetical protein [Salmonella enterica]MDR7938329.1 hypothetical protein [Salmonella enterica subsp. enterica serovar Gatineau]
MLDLNKEIECIESTSFFSKMGVNDIFDDSIIPVENVGIAFCDLMSVNDDFQKNYKKIEWLPTTATQEDPFYSKRDMPKELIEMRSKINKLILSKTRDMPVEVFVSSPHNFSKAARDAVCFAFRQYLYESYFDLGNSWARIVAIYHKGHWPIGYVKEKIVII